MRHGFEIRGPDLFSDGDHHEAKCRRQRIAHRTATKLGHASTAQAEGLHVQCRGDQGWDVLDKDLPRDI